MSGQGLPDLVRQPADDAFGQARVLRLDHQPDRGLGTARPHQHLPVTAEGGLRPGDRGGDLRPEPGRVAGYVDEDLRVLRHHLRRRRHRHAAAVDRGEQLQAGQHAVARGGVLTHDDVPGLFPAEHVAAVGEFADAAVIGTTVVSLIEKAEPGTAPAKVSAFLKGLRQPQTVPA